MLHLGVRFYEPEVGRFGQRDPAGEGLNWYSYVVDNPLSAVDPSGLWNCADTWRQYSGGGGDVDLVEEALLPVLQKSLQSTPDAFKGQCDKEAKSIAKSKCNGDCGSGEYASSFADSDWPNLTAKRGTYTFESTYIPMKASCQVVVVCETHTYRYSCTGNYFLKDWVRDPWDVFDVVPGNRYPYGHPYRMYARCNDQFAGYGSFQVWRWLST